MQKKPNADLLYFDSYCPSYNMKEKRQELRLNSSYFWRCVTCHLQLTTFAPYAVILRWRGEGQFRQTEDYTHNHYDKLIPNGTGLEPSNNIFPDPREVFYDSIDLEEYLQCVYVTESVYHSNQFDPNDPIIQKQEQYLGIVATEEWIDLVELYKEIKKEGMHADSFHAFRQKLYEQKIIFPFKWFKWCQGEDVLENPGADFSNCSLLELSMYLTLIFRADRFSDSTIQQCLENGVLDKLMRVDKVA